MTKQTREDKIFRRVQAIAYFIMFGIPILYATPTIIRELIESASQVDWGTFSIVLFIVLPLIALGLFIGAIVLYWLWAVLMLPFNIKDIARRG